ncbi:MAG: hypothetical protein B7Z12_20320 [Caulobacter vibrioides]|uniref:RNA polymerase sigma factor 70 region 4 type 2 domain-containing protein n=1 Tax=Caulobacter vibrioides TaxID=155892 RepID=A0A258CRE6_CAUVI|nr:MAG: hypothetical protein B7Z12_20320 [Caulobacter vibrioides]
MALCHRVEPRSRHGPDPETQIDHRLALERVSRRLDDLPEALRTALVLTAVTGLSYQEAAASLNITVKALEGRIARARKRLSVP